GRDTGGRSARARSEWSAERQRGARRPASAAERCRGQSPVEARSPPLSPLTAADWENRPMDDRHSRQLALPGFGPQQQSALAAARVLVIGAGGLGSTVIPALAGAGVGTLGIVDDDRVELSNLHRQSIHSLGDVGRPKAVSAANSV